MPVAFFHFLPYSSPPFFPFLFPFILFISSFFYLFFTLSASPVTFVPALLFQPAAIYDTLWKTFPLYHGTNLHELVLREEEKQQGEAVSVPQSKPRSTCTCSTRACIYFTKEKARRISEDLGGCIPFSLLLSTIGAHSPLLNLQRYCHYQFSKQCNPIGFPVSRYFPAIVRNSPSADT